jgi:pyridinium-3,5-bisthiocarboxylic acid mononucleotide nickel chelatase
MSCPSMAEGSNTQTSRHIHLDPVGGVAGDMFVAALADARPDLWPELEAALSAAGLPQGVVGRRLPETNGGISGTRFEVAIATAPPPSEGYPDIRRHIAEARVEQPVRERALAMLELLGKAEARIHGIALHEVHFHELAGWDTVVDLLASAWLIERLSPTSWSVGALPLGGGRIRTAHGLLPVPAPATANLLENFAWIDDAVPGERVTPTGAAILRHLTPERRPRPALILEATGHGLGTRRLEGLPNMLRVLLFQRVPAGAGQDEIGELRFEIDDQTAEDLAIGLDRLRAMEGVRDVVQWPVLGKRGRLGVAVQVLCECALLEPVAQACFHETSTIGLRLASYERRVLERKSRDVSTAHGTVPTKVVTRPSGDRTAKAESVVVEDTGTGFAGRQTLRRVAEEGALEDK